MSGLIAMMLSNDAVSDPRVEKEAEALAAAGYEVVVLAWDRLGAEPPSEARGSWRIERVGPRAVHGGGVRSIPRYLGYWSAAADRAVELGARYVHCHDLDTAPAGLSAVKRLTGASLVLDFHELYRHSRMLPQRGAAGVAARFAARLIERRAIPRAGLVLTVSPGQVEYYRQLGAHDVVLVENAPEIGSFVPVLRDEPEFVACFIGQKRWMPGLRALVEAVQRDPRLHALLAGGGPAEEAVARLAAQSERTEAIGRLSYAQIPALYQRCDAVFACYDNALENWRTAFPVKVMEGMASALPVIVSKGSWVAGYVEEHGIGLVADGSDPDSVAQALLALADDRRTARDMGAAGRALVEAGLNWEAAAARLVEAYEGL
jgi:glycosyltransferase involved in cell wall biosynthesis